MLKFCRHFAWQLMRDVGRHTLANRQSEIMTPTLPTPRPAPMTKAYLDSTDDQMRSFVATEIDGPIVMLNLLRFDPDGGAERYARYIVEAKPFLEKVGGTIRYLGAARSTLIGGEDWDEVLLVEYPSRQAFFDMAGDPDYPSELRASSLLDSRLICTTAREV
jgi:uncharacterized protein (DUF1330 family)